MFRLVHEETLFLACDMHNRLAAYGSYGQKARIFQHPDKGPAPIMPQRPPFWWGFNPPSLGMVEILGCVILNLTDAGEIEEPLL